MRCGLVDIGCFLSNWFWSLPWWVHGGLLLLLALALWGIGARVWAFAKGFGGWQAAVAAVGAAGLILVAIWPKAAHKATADDMFPHPDGESFRPRKPKKGEKPPLKEPWLRQPGETAADWLERTTKTK